MYIFIWYIFTDVNTNACLEFFPNIIFCLKEKKTG